VNATGKAAVAPAAVANLIVPDTLAEHESVSGARQKPTAVSVAVMPLTRIPGRSTDCGSKQRRTSSLNHCI
jgi:hypothetical protein